MNKAEKKALSEGRKAGREAADRKYGPVLDKMSKDVKRWRAAASEAAEELGKREAEDLTMQVVEAGVGLTSALGAGLLTADFGGIELVEGVELPHVTWAGGLMAVIGGGVSMMDNPAAKMAGRTMKAAGLGAASAGLGILGHDVRVDMTRKTTDSKS